MASPPAESPLTTAQRLHGLGLCVIPVPRPRVGAASGTPGDGKVPVLAWKPYQERLPTEAEIAQWFGAEPMNLAIITGKVSDVVVVDADSPEALRWVVRRLPYTPWQTQTARGWHCFYRHPGSHVRNRARVETDGGKLAIDVRGEGGFVIGPGSVHATGALYVEAGDWSVPRDRLPLFESEWLAPQQVLRSTDVRQVLRSTTVPRRPAGDLASRARAYLASIPRPVIGQGSDGATLYAACRLVRGFGLPLAEAEVLLWEWAGGGPGWTRDWVARKVAHAERYGSELVGALR